MYGLQYMRVNPHVQGLVAGMIKGESFGDRVAYYRKRLSRMSQQELATRVGVRRATVSEWENNRREPTVTHLVKLMMALEVGCDELLQGLPSPVERGDVPVGPDWSPEIITDSPGYQILSDVEKEYPSDRTPPADFLREAYVRGFNAGLRSDEFQPIDNRRDDLLPPRHE
jgi:transcriptional regulator with XRE-family HTH domain